MIDSEPEHARAAQPIEGQSLESILTQVFDLLDAVDVDDLRYVQRYLVRRARGEVGSQARSLAQLSVGRRDDRPRPVLADDAELDCSLLCKALPDVSKATVSERLKTLRYKSPELFTQRFHPVLKRKCWAFRWGDVKHVFEDVLGEQ